MRTIKIKIIRGSGAGSHPCAGAGWDIIAESYDDEVALTKLSGRLKERYPDAFQTSPLYPEYGERIKKVHIDSCTTRHVAGTPVCGGRPEGALDVAWAVLDALASR